MPLTAHDRRILHLAARSTEGRLTFCLKEDGSVVLMGMGEDRPLPAQDSIPRLEQLGLMSRAVNRSYVLTPAGWDQVRKAEAMEPADPCARMLGA
jgi:hypothetical protein